MSIDSFAQWPPINGHTAKPGRGANVYRCVVYILKRGEQMSKQSIRDMIIEEINKGLKSAMEATGNIYVLSDLSIEEESK